MATNSDNSFADFLQGAEILVTGGTGFTGRHLVRRLVACGARVRVTARPTSSREELRDLPIQWLVGKLHDKAFVEGAVSGVHYIFHLASAYRQTYRSEEEHYDIHVRSTEHLARSAVAESGFRRFIHVSSIGVHGHIDNPPADENAPFSPGDVYQQSKLEAEQWLRGFADQTGLPAVVVRPAAIYGPGDRRLLKVFKMATWPVVPLIGYGRHLYHLVHVDDLVDFLLCAAVHPNAVGEAVICAGPEPIPIKDFIQCAGAALGVHTRCFRLPVWPLMAAAVVCDRVCRTFRVQPPLYPRRVAFFTKDRAFDTSKMRKRLGFQASWGNEEGIAATARWYVEQGWIRPKTRGESS